MKKFGIIAVLAMFAIGVSAQEPARDHQHQDGNRAYLNQKGWLQKGFIFQYGSDNKATINQGVRVHDHNDFSYDQDSYRHRPSFDNWAIITQIGKDNEGTINQNGHKNFASLTQINFSWHHGPQDAGYTEDHWGPRGPEATINQPGSHNYAAVLQIGKSELEINQCGNFNVIAGLRSHNHGAYVPDNGGNHVGPLTIGHREDIEITQTSNGNYFYGIGMLKHGEATITQGNDLHHQHGDFGPQAGYHHLDFNVILLAQDGGKVILDQNGKRNFIWLDVEARHHSDPFVKIEQTGVKNSVAQYRHPWSHHASEAAEFEGKCLTVDQTGYGNKLSIEGKDRNGVIHVNQTGAFNFGKIEQRSFGHHH